MFFNFLVMDNLSFRLYAYLFRNSRRKANENKKKKYAKHEKRWFLHYMFIESLTSVFRWNFLFGFYLVNWTSLKASVYNIAFFFLFSVTFYHYVFDKLILLFFRFVSSRWLYAKWKVLCGEWRRKFCLLFIMLIIW
jgi:hypothetical protein